MRAMIEISTAEEQPVGPHVARSDPQTIGEVELTGCFGMGVAGATSGWEMVDRAGVAGGRWSGYTRWEYIAGE